MTGKVKENQRQRAPSQRSIATRDRIFDAAEQLFSERGFEGASIRDIARIAGVQGALVNHHGGSKEYLFATIVARRADELSRLRLDALDQMKANGALSVRQVLSCFILPFMDRVLHGGAAWSAYGRLIAHVSSDARWHYIAQSCFDPTVKVFLDEISTLLPQASREEISAHFVFMVSSMLSLCTSRWRIDNLSEGNTEENRASLVITGTEGMVVSYAKCCLPIPGDDVMGYLSSGRGVVVHRNTCGNLINFRKQPEKWIAVDWEKDIDRQFASQIQVDTLNKPGVLAEVAATIGDCSSNIEQVSVLGRHEDCSVLSFHLQVRDRTHLAQIMRNVRNMPNVIRVARECA